MTSLKCALALLQMYLLEIRRNLGTALVIVATLAGVVGVVVAIMAISAGIQATVAGTGRTDRVIIQSAGARSEMSSSLARAATDRILGLPGIRTAGDGTLITSSEFLAPAEVFRKDDGSEARVTVRGVGRAALQLRPEIRIVSGRMLEPGARELIAGRMAPEQFRGVSLGGEVLLNDGAWRVVGIFESGGDLHESELLADANTLMSAYRSNRYTTMLVALQSDAAFGSFVAGMDADPTLQVKAFREREFYAQQSEEPTRIVKRIGLTVGGIMGLGAILATLTAMYAVVNARARDIVFLRAVGFTLPPLIVALILEIAILALVGAGLGAAVAWAVFDGRTISLSSDFTLSGAQLVLQQTVTAELLLLGAGFALALGLVSALLASISLARMSLTAGSAAHAP